MIGYIKGKVLLKNKESIILLTNSIGYNINVVDDFIIDSEIELFILTIIKDNDLTLYGFKSLEEKDLFEKFVSIKGIGPKISQKIISNDNIENIIINIKNKNSLYFLNIKGIGEKASILIIDKLSKYYYSDTLNNIDYKSIVLNLGFSVKDYNKVKELIDYTLSEKEVVKQILGLLNER